jgi:hypothetical protein
VKSKVVTGSEPAPDAAADIEPEELEDEDEE